MTTPWSRSEIEQIVVDARLHLYNHACFCGARAIERYLIPQIFLQTPSARTIHRILVRNGLTHGRTGFYDGEIPPPSVPSPTKPPCPTKPGQKACRRADREHGT